jgi:spore cortex formation protein SpoVR/YcgB (stage V sporulation)
MSKLEVILSAVLFFSVIFNVGIFVYARAAIRRLLMVSGELGDLQTMVDAFAKHTKSVYELEMFYGDTTLEHLLNHAVSLNEQLETFEYVYSLTEEEPIEMSEEEQKELFDDAEEDQAPQA